MQNKTKPKPRYLLGIFCLIPLFGAVVGLALLLFGIFHYKSKVLSIIGAFGILFTVGIYSFLSYYHQHGKVPKQLRAEISQKQLNDLVEKIENYKLRHGNYPDSLQQLLQSGFNVNITDAIQFVQERPNTNFNYKRLDIKYILFSSGQDGIPNTHDDIFPVGNKEDSINNRMPR